MKNKLLGKKYVSCSFYLYRFRKYVSYGFPTIIFGKPGIHYETPCICIEFYRYLDIFTDAVPNVTLSDIERRTVLLAFTIVEINCRKKVPILGLFQISAQLKILRRRTMIKRAVLV